MGRCIYCGKTKAKNEDVSFHRFPKDEKLVKLWVKNMGKNNWMPKEWHMLCAQHFSKELIDFRDYRARLRKGSIPTIFHPDKEDSSLSSDVALMVHVNKHIELDDNPTEPGSKMSSLSVHHTPLDVQMTSTLETKTDSHSTSAMQINDQPQGTSVDVILHDHTYAEYGDIVQRKLEYMRVKVDKLMRDKRILSQKSSRYRERIKNFEEIVATLHKALDIQADDMQP
ncbi:THAP domain-containing protein 1 [Diachasma alloeum]|uniref:THAP domain-containing protein 1 n=1 Tax=Diachasma alloeum TaxID=454923 RepID=UPI0007384C5F|nr:THAP domain-containing protein 1 [Diachasma alloeum]